MESSIITTRWPSTTRRTALSFILTPCSRSSWLGWIKVRPVYLFLISPSSYGMPVCSAYPIAAEILESGTPVTISASTKDSSAIRLPIRLRAEWRLEPFKSLSGRAK
ncbi:hypothetical protein D3C75_761600 [compost metagenome]